MDGGLHKAVARSLIMVAEKMIVKIDRLPGQAGSESGIERRRQVQ